MSRVAAQAPLLRLARAAFLSATRAYRAFPRELRSCFNASRLHSGHFANSFALRESPNEAAKREKRAAGVGPKPKWQRGSRAAGRDTGGQGGSQRSSGGGKHKR